MALSTVPSAVCIDSDTGGRGGGAPARDRREPVPDTSRAPGDGDSRLRIRSARDSFCARLVREPPGGTGAARGRRLQSGRRAGAPRSRARRGGRQGTGQRSRAACHRHATAPGGCPWRAGRTARRSQTRRRSARRREHARGPAHDGASRLTQVSRGMRGGGGAAAPGSFCGPERSSEPSTRRVPPSWPTGLLPRTERSWPRSSTCGEW